jgi:hypothetical protein
VFVACSGAATGQICVFGYDDCAGNSDESRNRCLQRPSSVVNGRSSDS